MSSHTHTSDLISFQARYSYELEDTVQIGVNVLLELLPDHKRSTAHQRVYTWSSVCDFEEEDGLDVQVSAIYVKQEAVGHYLRYTTNKDDTAEYPYEVKKTTAPNVAIIRGKSDGKDGPRPDWYSGQGISSQGSLFLANTHQPTLTAAFQVNFSFLLPLEKGVDQKCIQSSIVFEVITPPIRSSMLSNNNASIKAKFLRQAGVVTVHERILESAHGTMEVISDVQICLSGKTSPTFTDFRQYSIANGAPGERRGIPPPGSVEGCWVAKAEVIEEPPTFTKDVVFRSVFVHKLLERYLVDMKVMLKITPVKDSCTADRTSVTLRSELDFSTRGREICNGMAMDFRVSSVYCRYEVIADGDPDQTVTGWKDEVLIPTEGAPFEPVGLNRFKFIGKQVASTGQVPRDWYLMQAMPVISSLSFENHLRPRVKMGYLVNLSYRDARGVRKYATITNAMLTGPIHPGMCDRNEITLVPRERFSSPDDDCVGDFQVIVGISSPRPYRETTKIKADLAGNGAKKVQRPHMGRPRPASSHHGHVRLPSSITNSLISNKEKSGNVPTERQKTQSKRYGIRHPWLPKEFIPNKEKSTGPSVSPASPPETEVEDLKAAPAVGPFELKMPRILSFKVMPDSSGSFAITPCTDLELASEHEAWLDADTELERPKVVTHFSKMPVGRQVALAKDSMDAVTESWRELSLRKGWAVEE